MTVRARAMPVATNTYTQITDKRLTSSVGAPTLKDNKTTLDLNDTCQKEVRMPSNTESSLLDGNSHTTAWPGGRPYTITLHNVLTQTPLIAIFNLTLQYIRCLLLWTVCGYRSGQWSRDGYKLRLRRSLRNFWLMMNSIRHRHAYGRRMTDSACPYCKSNAQKNQSAWPCKLYTVYI